MAKSKGSWKRTWMPTALLLAAIGVVAVLLLGVGSAAQQGALTARTPNLAPDGMEPALARGAGDSWYYFNATGLPVNSTLVVDFGHYPGKTFGPTNLTVTDFGTPPTTGSYPAHILVNVSWNVTFLVIFPNGVGGGTTCTDYGQICTTTTYNYVSATDSVNTTVHSAIAFTYGKSSNAGSNVTVPTGVTAYHAPLAYNATTNWAVGYAPSTSSADTPLGGFLQTSDSWLYAIFGVYWYGWLAFAVVVVLIAFAYGGKSRRR
jgi:hypothetical protein